VPHGVGGRLRAAPSSPQSLQRLLGRAEHGVHLALPSAAGWRLAADSPPLALHDGVGGLLLNLRAARTPQRAARLRGALLYLTAPPPEAAAAPPLHLLLQRAEAAEAQERREAARRRPPPARAPRPPAAAARSLLLWDLDCGAEAGAPAAALAAALLTLVARRCGAPPAAFAAAGRARAFAFAPAAAAAAAPPARCPLCLLALPAAADLRRHVARVHGRRSRAAAARAPGEAEARLEARIAAAAAGARPTPSLPPPPPRPLLPGRSADRAFRLEGARRALFDVRAAPRAWALGARGVAAAGAGGAAARLRQLAEPLLADGPGALLAAASDDARVHLQLREAARRGARVLLFSSQPQEGLPWAGWAEAAALARELQASGEAAAAWPAELRARRSAPLGAAGSWRVASLVEVAPGEGEAEDRAADETASSRQ